MLPEAGAVTSDAERWVEHDDGDAGSERESRSAMAATVAERSARTKATNGAATR